MRLQARKFDFNLLVESHGWVHLPPHSWCPDQKMLTRPLAIGGRSPVRVEIRASTSCGRSVVRVRPVSERVLPDSQRAELRRQVRRMLWLDHSFEQFHALCRSDRHLRFVSEAAAGGLLRSPTAFEDLIKTVCTTNCDWRNTKKMTARLCDMAGGAFPSPGQLLRFTEAQLAERASLGYRARTVLEAAQLAEDGGLPLDDLARRREFAEIGERLAGIWGVGPYCVRHMLVLLGSFDEIPVDSEVLKYLRAEHFGGEPVRPSEAVGPYDRYGQHKFLAYKFRRVGRKLNYVDK